MTVRKRTKKRTRVDFEVSIGNSHTADLSDVVKSALISGNVLDEERAFFTQRAPNAIEWATRPEFLNSPEVYAHWGQYETIRDFFCLACPICNTEEDLVVWGKSRESLESQVLLTYNDHYQDDACPKCRVTRCELVAEGELPTYHTMSLLVGQRSSKSATVALVGTYCEHVALTLAHREEDGSGLHKYLKVPFSDVLEGTYLAANAVQAQDTIWAKFTGYRQLSPWFQRYVPYVKGLEKLQALPVGMKPWRYVENETEIENGFARIKQNSLNSNSSGLRGRTRLWAFADEISHMKQTDSSQGADEIYRALSNSLATVRGAVKRNRLSIGWLGFMGAITSPVSVDDKGYRLYEAGKSDPNAYVRKAATWEFTPFLPRSNFDSDYILDPVGTERDFGANPPMAEHPLIPDRVSFEDSAIDWELKPSATFVPYEFQDQDGRSYLGIRLDSAKLILKGSPRYIAFDPGKTFDAFAGACAHAEYDEDGRVITVFDWVIRLLPRKGQEVFFECITEIIEELQKFQVIQRVEFDQWSSTQLIQDIRNKLGIVSEESPTKDKHFMQFVRDAMSGRVRMLPPKEDNYDICAPDIMSPEGVALYELERLDVDLTGKVSNPKKGLKRGWNSNDVANVITHAHRLCQDIGFTERYDDQSRRAKRIRAEASVQAMERGGGGARIFKPSAGMKGLGGRGW